MTSAARARHRASQVGLGEANGSDFLQLRPELAPKRGIAAWLAGAVRAAVAQGRLAPGELLPPTRALAHELGVSRGVVSEAYDRLQAEGLVEGRGRSGTVVVGPAPSVLPAKGGEGARVFTFRVPELPGALSGPRPPIDFDLSPGLPDLTGFPRARWLRAHREVLATAGPRDFAYGDPRGHLRLREELAHYLSRLRGVRAAADDVIVVNGVAQGLALLAQVLVRAGTRSIGVEDPGSRGARDEVAYWGLSPHPVPVDDEGMVMDVVVNAGLPAALMTPAHQFPTGAVLSPGRRRQAAHWAQSGGLIVEDDYDAEYRYDRAPVPALQATVPDQTVYLGSVSKILSPALRLGWIVARGPLSARLLDAKEASDISTATLPQLALAQMLGDGSYESHLRRTRARHRDRRNALVQACRVHLPGARVGGVAAGLSALVVWPELATHVTDVEMAEVALQAGVLVHPLSVHRQLPGAVGLVLGYAAHTPGELARAVERLAGALRPLTG